MTSAQARDLTHGRRQARQPAVTRTQAPPGPVPSGQAPGGQSADSQAEAGQAEGGPGGSGLSEIPAREALADESQLLLVADPESVKAARDFTAATLRGWRLAGLVDEGMVIASELVTNAIRHGRCLAATGDAGKVELCWQRFDSRVICVVTDGSAVPPVMADADMSAESGRGLHVVEALALVWGWTMVGTGEKAVWAALPVRLRWPGTSALAGPGRPEA